MILKDIKQTMKKKKKKLQILFLTRLEEFQEKFQEKSYEHKGSKNKDIEHFKKEIEKLKEENNRRRKENEHIKAFKATDNPSNREQI